MQSQSLAPTQLTIAKAVWVLAMLGVLVMALLPAEHLKLPILNWWDKAQHALAFAVLSTGALLLWRPHRLRVAVGMVLYGAAIEVAQWAVGWRFAEWADLGADTFGVAIAYALTMRLKA